MCKVLQQILYMYYYIQETLSNVHEAAAPWWAEPQQRGGESRAPARASAAGARRRRRGRGWTEGGRTPAVGHQEGAIFSQSIHMYFYLTILQQKVDIED